MVQKSKTSGGWDGVFKKFKDDKNVLARIGMLQNRHTEYDVKTKDCDRMKNYVPDTRALLRISKAESRHKPMNLTTRKAEDWRITTGNFMELKAITDRPMNRNISKFGKLEPERSSSV